MTSSWRVSALADRHRAMGSKLEDWNGMGTAWSYETGNAEAEYTAIRTKAGLMDVSGLKKAYVTGPAASHLLDVLTTRNVEKIMPGRCAYATILNEGGKFVDDCIIYRFAPNNWMIVHGAGAGYEELTRLAVGMDVSVRFDDNLHDLSLQGPTAVDFLARHIPGIRDLAAFGVYQGKLFDRAVTITRTGYTGERGYEIFVRAQDVGHVWDSILADGKPEGIIPCRFSTLDLLRVESYLLFFPDDNSHTFPFENEAPGDTLWELGLDFTVSPNKKGFRGAEEHYRLKGKERFKIFGVKLEGTEPADTGALIYRNGKKVGIATAGMYSPVHKHSVAIARLDVDCAVVGTELEVHNKSGIIKATAQEMPFDDPKKLKRAAKG